MCSCLSRQDWSVPGDKIFSGSSSLRTQSSSQWGLQTLLLVDEPWPKLHLGQQCYQIRMLSGTSKPYSSKSLGLFVSQVVFPCFILNYTPHLAQQLTPDEEGLCFGGAAVLSSSFDNFLKSFQAHCRPEIGSNTLRLDVCA